MGIGFCCEGEIVIFGFVYCFDGFGVCDVYDVYGVVGFFVEVGE